MPEADPFDVTEAFERACERRQAERRREADEPVLWTLLGLLLVACFVLALTTHWFPK
jgi:hypothetical protein